MKLNIQIRLCLIQEIFYGLTQNYDLETSGKIGALVSGKVVEVMGANLPDYQWSEIHEEIRKIVELKN